MSGWRGFDSFMKKLNFGCGTRIAAGWENIDFFAQLPSVKAINLLRPLPYEDNTFDAVYSSHVLEHFSKKEATRILRECHRVLKSGGILRTVLPDLEAICREYLRNLDEARTFKPAEKRHEWSVIELIDQMVRTEPSGEMGAYKQALLSSADDEMIKYVKSRTENVPWEPIRRESLVQKLRSLTPGKLLYKAKVTYVRGVLSFVPRALREAMLDRVPVGEKHRWMYDRLSLEKAMYAAGFRDVVFCSAESSSIAGFEADGLDLNADGTPYKNVSLFCECRKP